MTDTPAPVAVLTVELLASAFGDADSARILRLWRDGQLRPVVNRPLIRCYLKLLHGLTLPDRVLRWWAIWFACPDKVVFIQTELDCRATLQDHYLRLAVEAQAKLIILGHSGSSLPQVGVSTNSVEWITAADYLNRISRAGNL